MVSVQGLITLPWVWVAPDPGRDGYLGLIGKVGGRDMKRPEIRCGKCRKWDTSGGEGLLCMHFERQLLQFES